MLTPFRRGFADPFFNDAFRLHKELLGLPVEESGREVRTYNPPVDIHEDEHAVTLSVELPGLKAEDVDIEVDRNVLSVKGRRAAKHENKEGAAFRTERWYGAFQRAFTLPDSVDTGAIEAHMEDGVLSLRLPKKAEVKPRKITVGESQARLKAA